MKKFEMLRLGLQLGNYRKLSWYISLFSVLSEPEGKWKEDPYQYRIVMLDYGTFVVVDGELQKIEDVAPKKPLFEIFEKLIVTPEWIVSCKEPTESTVGSLLINYILCVENFQGRVPYIPKNITIKKIETAVIALRKKDDDPDPTKIKLSEYLRMYKSVEYLKCATQLSVYSLTPKNMTTGDSFKKEKAELLKQYEGQLNDPVKLAEFEEKIMQLDAKHLQGDPTFGRLMSGKLWRNSRRKMVLTSGAEGGMGGKMVAVPESLQEGVPLTPENMVAMVNGSRGGSYFRGLDTVKGGVSLKFAVRALLPYYVKEGDCKTKIGIEKKYTKFNLDNLVGRTLMDGTKVQDKNAAGNYLGKVITVRSVAGCSAGLLEFCSTCAGILSHFPEGLVIPAAELTGDVMTASMKAMHKNTTTTAVFKLEDVIC